MKSPLTEIALIVNLIVSLRFPFMFIVFIALGEILIRTNAQAGITLFLIIVRILALIIIGFLEVKTAPTSGISIAIAIYLLVELCIMSIAAIKVKKIKRTLLTSRL